MTATGRRRLRGEDGTGLVELLTAIGISAVVLAFVTGTVVDALRAQRRQTAQVEALNDANVGFERVTRDLRGAHPLVAVAPDQISLDIVRPGDDALRRVTYERVDNKLVVTDGGGGPTRALARNLAPSPPLFVFHLADGTTASGATTVNPRSVQAVTVHLRLEPAGAGRVVDLETRVVVRNSVL